MEDERYISHTRGKFYLLVRDVIAGIVAPPVTFWSGGSLRAGLPGAVDMMLAGLDDVGLTALVTPVLTSGHQAFPSPEGPRCAWETWLTMLTMVMNKVV